MNLSTTVGQFEGQHILMFGMVVLGSRLQQS